MFRSDTDALPEAGLSPPNKSHGATRPRHAISGLSELIAVLTRMQDKFALQRTLNACPPGAFWTAILRDDRSIASV